MLPVDSRMGVATRDVPVAPPSERHAERQRQRIKPKPIQFIPPPADPSATPLLPEPKAAKPQAEVKAAGEPAPHGDGGLFSRFAKTADSTARPRTGADDGTSRGRRDGVDGTGWQGRGARSGVDGPGVDTAAGVARAGSAVLPLAALVVRKTYCGPDLRVVTPYPQLLSRFPKQTRVPSACQERLVAYRTDTKGKALVTVPGSRELLPPADSRGPIAFRTPTPPFRPRTR